MILRICVVVPVFDNPRTISTVVKEIVASCEYPILIVDDGSETPVANVLYSWEVRQALESGRVRVVRFAQNRGKGAALRYAIDDLVARGFTHMLTIDGDGQHFAREIPKLVEGLTERPWDLVIGNRRMEGETVPPSSRFGRKMSNFWISYETGGVIRDSQSGFRLYPLFPLQTMRFLTRKFDFETEVLIRLMWKGVAVREVEIDVHYPRPGERVSHFDKLWDNVRLTAINALFVFVSLARDHREPGRLALAAGIGVFVGCTPFLGFHAPIVVGISFLTRLNVVAMLLASQISIPPLAPLIAFASIFIGGELGLENPIARWLAGSALLGSSLGLLTAVVAYSIGLYRGRRAKTNWSGRARGGRFGLGFMKMLTRKFGVKPAYAMLYTIVPYFWLFAPKARRGLNEYYRVVYPSLDWAGRQRAILHHFFRFGQILIDRLHQGMVGGPGRVGKTSGVENLRGARVGDRGLILLGAHIGGWDIASLMVGERGFADQIHIVEYRASGLTFQQMKDRENPEFLHSVNTAAGGAIFEIHQVLAAGHCLGLLGDRPLGDRFELIPFLGKIAPFDVTAFRVAAATRTPLIFTFGFRGEDGYDFYALKPRVYEYDSARPRDEQLCEWVGEYAREMERLLLRYPEQWFNFYPFWSSLPLAPNGQPVSPASNRLARPAYKLAIPEPVSELDRIPSASSEA